MSAKDSGGKITYKATPNNISDNRSATITISYLDQDVKIVVSQEAKSIVELSLKSESDDNSNSELTKELTSENQDNKLYSVGDYYDYRGKQGVVFEVWEDGRHGKIVSMDEINTIWHTYIQFEKGIVVGTTNELNGYTNTQKISVRDDRDQYPAFMWCISKGAGWYLPAKNELLTLYKHRKSINNTITEKGGTPLGVESYWSSTEFIGEDNYRAWSVYMSNGFTSNNGKSSDGYVRAVSAF